MNETTAQRTVRLGPMSELTPTVNLANRFPSLPGQKWGPRTIPDCELIYVISGKLELQLGQRHYPVSSGGCVFFGMDSPHRLVASDKDPAVLSCIHFSWNGASPEPINPVPLLCDVPAGELQTEPVHYTVELDGCGEVRVPYHFVVPGLELLFQHIVEEYQTEGFGYAVAMRGLLTHLLTVVLRHQVRAVGAEDDGLRRIEPALSAIRGEARKEWKTRELARICGYHPAYFSKLFKDTTGRSPKHYMMLERIHQAKRLLQQQLTVERVAERLGYTSIHYFSRNFKAITGLTPSEYKRRSTEL